jgi:uncharacterized oxidoreductase
VAGVFLVAIDPAAFGEPLEYRRQVAGVLDAVSEVAPLAGVEHVQVAGDPERASRDRRQREGIALPLATWDDLMAIGSRFGLSL